MRRTIAGIVVILGVALMMIVGAAMALQPADHRMGAGERSLIGIGWTMAGLTMVLGTFLASTGGD